MSQLRKNASVILKTRPEDYPRADHFTLSNSSLTSIGPGQMRVKNLFLSVDPAMRGWVSDERNYLEPVAIGAVMRSLAVGQVLESQHPDFNSGDYVTGWFGWQQFANVERSQIIRRIHEYGQQAPLPLSSSLGVLGLNGITAYLALQKIGRPQLGETLLVSTAAGAVGSIAGQLGKLAGCRVIGLTGSDAKVAQCVKEFGFDAALNYKKFNSPSELQAAIGSLTGSDLPSAGYPTSSCESSGVDIFFDNTGGGIADACLASLNKHARIIQCGTAAIGSWDPLPDGPRRERYFITKRLLQQGFVIFDHLEQWPTSVDTLSGLIRSGQLKYSEDIQYGLSQAPQALENLYSGGNLGKSIIEVEHAH